MAEAAQYLGPGVVAEELAISQDWLRKLRRAGRFPPPELEIVDRRQVRVGWRPATIRSLRSLAEQPDGAPGGPAARQAAAGPARSPRRCVGMNEIAARCGVSRQRGYELLGTDQAFPAAAVELREPTRTHLGWDEPDVDAYVRQRTPTPGRRPAARPVTGTA